MHPYLYRFYVVYGRMGSLEGLFIAHPKMSKKLLAMSFILEKFLVSILK